MIEKLVDGFLANGVLGLAVLGMAMYILFLHKTYVKVHKQSQDDWKDIAREGHNIMRENTSILSALKTLLETTREKIR